MKTTPSGIRFNYILVVNPDTEQEVVSYKHTARYTVVSEALKLEKAGTAYEIMKFNITSGQYEHDDVGPQVIAANAALHGKKAPASTSTVDKELISKLQECAQACNAIASMERKGQNTEETMNDWARAMLHTLDAAGFTKADISKLQKETSNAF